MSEEKLYLGQPLPSRQEMFNRAWNGLKGQGWRTAFNPDHAVCTYLTDDGRRCAWGHVDPQGTTYRYYANGKLYSCNGGVWTLAHGVASDNLAKHLSQEDQDWAIELQDAHDRCGLGRLKNGTTDERWTEAELKASMELFAKEYSLSIPAEDR